MGSHRARDGTRFSVSAEDDAWVGEQVWTVHQVRGKSRLVRWERIPEHERTRSTTDRMVMLHRQVATRAGMLNPESNAWIGFRDDNPLNLRRENLRMLDRTAHLHASGATAARAKARRGIGSSPYLGVSRKKKGSRIVWQATLRLPQDQGGRLLWLGEFPGTPEGEKEAALAYDRAVTERGLERRLNFPLRKRRVPRAQRERSTERATLTPADYSTRREKPRPALSSAPAQGPIATRAGPVIRTNARAPEPPERSDDGASVEALYQKPFDELSPEELARMRRAFLSTK